MDSAHSSLLRKIICGFLLFCAASMTALAQTENTTNDVTTIQDKTLYDVLIHVRHCDQLYNQVVTFDSSLFTAGAGTALIKASKTAFCQITVQPVGEADPVACDYTKAQLAAFFDTSIDKKVRDFDNKAGSLFEVRDLLSPIIDCYKKTRAQMAKDAGAQTAAPPEKVITKTGDQPAVTIEQKNVSTDQQKNTPSEQPAQKDSDDQQYNYGKMLQ